MTKIKRTVATAFLLGLICALGGARPSWPQQANSSDPDLTYQAMVGDPQTPVAGNPRGDLTIVEFFDYNCPFCIKAEPALEKLIAGDNGIRLVYKDWPIFGGGSIIAARMALAANWQGKYEAVHNALLRTASRKISADQIRVIAANAGADPARLEADLQAHARQIDAILARTEKQAEKLGVPGTPVFLIGPLLIESAPDLEGFQKSVRDARAKSQSIK